MQIRKGCNESFSVLLRRRGCVDCGCSSVGQPGSGFHARGVRGDGSGGVVEWWSGGEVECWSNGDMV